MNPIRIKLALLLWLSFLVQGCTVISVRKVTTGDEEGVQYSLPVSFLRATPSVSGDGTATFDFLYLPDNDQTYAIEADSYFASHTAEFTFSNGLLTKIVWDADSSEVAKDAVGAAQAAAKAQLDVSKAEKETKDKERKQYIDALRKKVDSAEADVRSKEHALKLAVIERDSLQSSLPDSPSDSQKEQLRQADLKVARAQADLDAATAELKRLMLLAEQDPSILSNLLNAPDDEQLSAWGPVLYRIVDTYDITKKTGGVKLVEVRYPNGKAQLPFPTAKTKPPAPTPRAPSYPFTLEEPVVVTESAAKKGLKIMRTFATEIQSLRKDDFFIENLPLKGSDLVIASLKSRKDLTLQTQIDLPEGDYVLHVPFSWPPDTETEVTIDIKVLADPPVKVPQLKMSGIERVAVGDAGAKVERTFTEQILRIRNDATKLAYESGNEVVLGHGGFGATIDTQKLKLLLHFGPQIPKGRCTAQVAFIYQDTTGAQKEARVDVDLLLEAAGD